MWKFMCVHLIICIVDVKKVLFHRYAFFYYEFIFQLSIISEDSIMDHISSVVEVAVFWDVMTRITC
jgi:hypothetical protein